MATPRIRTIKSAWEELLRMDPESAISQNYIRILVTNGVVPSLRSGSKYLVDLDKLMQYLNGETMAEKGSKL